MKPSLPRNILGYGLFIFLLIFFILMSLFVSPRKILNPIKYWFHLIFKSFGLRVHVQGLENLVPGQTYLFMPNHVSLFDQFILLAYLPGYFVGLEKIESFSYPLYGWAAKRWGQIPIDRKHHEAALLACQVVESRLSEGVSVAIFPEGTRTLNGKLSPFKKGPFHIAVDSKATVVPIILKGLFPLLPKGKILVQTGEVELKVCKPIPPAEVGAESTNQLLEQVRSIMLKELDSSNT